MDNTLITKLTNENNELKKQNDKLKQENADLKQENADLKIKINQEEENWKEAGDANDLDEFLSYEQGVADGRKYAQMNQRKLSLSGDEPDEPNTSQTYQWGGGGKKKSKRRKSKRKKKKSTKRKMKKRR